MPDEFPSNSRNGKQPPAARPKVERVVSGDVVRRKKPLGRRILQTFVGSDDARGVGEYLVQDVLVPMTRDLIAAFVTSGIERTLYGPDSRGQMSTTRNRMSAGNHTNYSRFSQGGGRLDSNRPDISPQARSTHNFTEFEYNNRFDAAEVLDTLLKLIDDYGVATVADFYEASGISGQFVDENHGWTDLSEARLRPVRGGKYTIIFPPTTDRL